MLALFSTSHIMLGVSSTRLPIRNPYPVKSASKLIVIDHELKRYRSTTARSYHQTSASSASYGSPHLDCFPGMDLHRAYTCIRTQSCLLGGHTPAYAIGTSHSARSTTGPSSTSGHPILYTSETPNQRLADCLASTKTDSRHSHANGSQAGILATSALFIREWD
ncbi:unnamed protein product [Peniophora sp. CBMAI 1063]|nr:unnamed protein product [Peniophora sp. CBMAI 1063]